MEKFIEYLQEAEKITQTADHLIYVTFPLVNDKRLLLKTVAQIKTAVANCINSILQYEYLYKRIKLYQNPKTNFQTFETKCARLYNITKSEVRLILELFDITKRHQESPFEFVKDNKVVIMSENSIQKIITIEKTKEFLLLVKSVLKKTKDRILR